MIKKYITLPSFITLFCIIINCVIALTFPEYTRYFLYVSILVLIPFIIVDLIKKRKEDKNNDTENFKFSVYNILISIVILGVLFFVINNNIN